MPILRASLRLIIRAAKGFVDDDCATMAAAIAYYSILSIFPLLLFILAVLGMFLKNPDLQQRIVSTIIGLIPSSSNSDTNILIDTINEVASEQTGVFSIVGILLLGWSASKISAIVRTSLNNAYDLNTFRPFFRQKLVDLGMVLGIGMFLFLSVLCTALLQAVRELSKDFLIWMPWSSIFFGEAGFFWNFLSYLIPLVLSFFGFLVLYSIIPAVRLPLKSVWPGATIATILFEIVKNGFTFYLIHFSNYQVVFGPLGAVIAFLMWAYLSAAVLLFGAEAASEYSKMVEE
jgi:membrane protein